MGGYLFFSKHQSQKVTQPVGNKSEIQKVDQVKFRLKKSRDTIKTFVSAKNKDLGQVERKIAQKLPAFKQTGSKKQLIPLLQAKRDLLKIINSGEVRLRLVNEKLEQVQMHKINAQTIDVLEQSNKYMRQIQQQLEKKDWKNLLQEAQQKYQLQWPQQQTQQEDPSFQQMWKQLAGDTITAKNNQTNPVEKKSLTVQAAQNSIQSIPNKTDLLQA